MTACCGDCQVYAKGSSFNAELREIGVNDYAFVMMQFRSGILATIELSRSSSYGYDQRLEVQEGWMLRNFHDDMSRD
eukprot:45509-Eustigmatos_ZCMA.PRE.1